VAHPTSLERFLAKVDKQPNGCWHWTATISDAGYGRFRVDGTSLRAHRFAYQLFVGPIPQGLHIDHVCHGLDAACAGGRTCMHRRCVNPEHLEAVTQRENLLRGLTSPARNAAKTHCVNGHPFNEVNTRFSGGGRRCRSCEREREYGRVR